MQFTSSMKKTLITILSLLLGVSIGATIHFYIPQAFGTATNCFVGTLPVKVSGSGISSSATSIGVVSFTIPQTGKTLTMADFCSNIGYATIEPGSSSRQEFISFTGITQNANGSATLTGVTRGLQPFSPYTASASYQFSHSGGSSLIVSNTPQFYTQFLSAGNDSTITGLYTYTVSPIVPTPTTDYQAATKKYADDLTYAGAPDADLVTKGIIQLATQGQAASSTALGSTGASLVVPTSMATDTPNTLTRASRVLMSDMTGYLKSAWLKLSDTFAWTGAHTWSALATMNGGLTSTATTTLAGSSVTNNAVVINGLAYQFPPAHSASSTVLTSNGTGKLIWSDGQVVSYVSTATSSLITAGAATFDTTYTTTFKPSTIDVHFWLTGTGDWGSERTSIGTATCTGTSGCEVLYLARNAADGNLTMDTPYAATENPYAGAADMNSLSTISITAITSTSYTVRIAFSGGSIYKDWGWKAYTVAHK